MPLYDYTLSDGRTVTLYRKMADMDKPISPAELAENGYPDQPATRWIPAVRHTVPDRIALLQFKADPHAQANQVMAGYRKAELQGKVKSTFTPDQIKQAWSDDRAPDLPDHESAPETAQEVTA